MSPTRTPVIGTSSPQDLIREGKWAVAPLTSPVETSAISLAKPRSTPAGCERPKPETLGVLLGRKT